MARNTASGKKGPRGNSPTALILAGFTALVILVAFAVAVLSTIRSGGETSNFTPNDEGLIPPSQQAPEFTTETVSGDKVSLGGSQATMLVFFATWCPHCQKEAPVISDLEDQYEDLRVIMVGIDGQDNPDKVQQFVEEYGIEGPAIYQPSLGETYRVSGYPTVYVINGNGEIVGAHAGEAPREVFEQWVEKAL